MIESLLTVTTNSTSTLVPTAANNMSSFVMPFGGSALIGFLMGYALKKIIKWTLVILGVCLGIIFLAIQWMSNNGYITGKIMWDKLGNDTFAVGQQALHQLDINSVHGLFHTLGIPITFGLGIGLVAGFVKAH